MEIGSLEMIIHTNAGDLRFYHIFSCCEDVYISEINGEIEDLIGKTVVMSEERTKGFEGKEYEENDHTEWTFYEIRTTGGDLQIAWKGVSDYYSLEVEVEWIEKQKQGIKNDCN